MQEATGSLCIPPSVQCLYVCLSKWDLRSGQEQGVVAARFAFSIVAGVLRFSTTARHIIPHG